MNQNSVRHPLVSVIVLNYNGLVHTPACLDSLKEQTAEDYEVIVIDNASTDGSLEVIERDYPWVKLIKSDRNQGFVANNLGFEASKAKYQVVLNNDTTVRDDFVQQIIAPAENDPSVGMVGGKVMSMKAEGIIDSVGVNIYPDGMSGCRGRLEEDSGQYDDDTEIFLTSGCCSLYRKEMLDETGGYDHDFFLYCEDTDLAIRGRLAGWRAVLAPRAVVYHAFSSSSGAVSALKAYYVERNHLWVLWKLFPVSMILAAPLATIFRYYHQALAAIRGEGASGGFVKDGGGFLKLAGVLVKAYWSFFVSLPGILAKRREVMKGRRMTNREFKTLCRRFRLTAKDLAYK